MSKLRIKYFNCTLEIIWLNCPVLLTSSHSTLPSFLSFLTFFCHFEIHFSPRWPGKFCTLKQKYNSFKTYFREIIRFDINPDYNSFLQKIVKTIFSNLIIVKFIYSEKATIFSEISTVDLSYVVTVKSIVEISQNYVAFLEYMNFIKRKKKAVHLRRFS